VDTHYAFYHGGRKTYNTEVSALVQCYHNNQLMNLQGKITAITTAYQDTNRIKNKLFYDADVSHKGVYINHYYSRSFRNQGSKIKRWAGQRSVSSFLHQELDCREIALDEPIRKIVDITELLYSQLPHYQDYEVKWTNSDDSFVGDDPRGLVTRALMEQFRSVLY